MLKELEYLGQPLVLEWLDMTLLPVKVQRLIILI